ncbi:MAG TPA: dickkopf-related protein, partial [Polyangia bacterium]
MHGRSAGRLSSRIGLVLLLIAGCGHDGAPAAAGPDDAGAASGTSEAAAIGSSSAAEAALARHRKGFAAAPAILAGGAARIETDGQWLRPTFRDDGGRAGATVALPLDARGTFTVRSTATRMSVDVALVGARGALGEVAGGWVIYRGAAPDGGDLLHRPTAAGTEDLVVLERAPARPELAWRVIPGDGVAGLRLVAGTLELLAADGDPQLRMAPPYLIDAAGARHEARVAVEGCDVDTSPVASWRRSVTAPGAAACTVRISWEGAPVAYPALLDPSWTNTGSMGIQRDFHTLTPVTVAGAPLVLVAGGFFGIYPPPALTELFDPSGNAGLGSWSPTGSMKAGRINHTANVVNVTVNTGGLKPTGTMVLVAGGFAGGAPMSSSELYNPATGLWDYTWNGLGSQTTMVTGRYSHTATSLTAGGRVLAAGGLTPGRTAAAEIFDPATGNWVATGTMVYARDSQAASLLGNGKVLVTGGNATSNTSAELWDPGTGVWTFTRDAFGVQTIMANPHVNHTATVLPSGKVLVAGSSCCTMAAYRSVELYDPVSSTFATTGSLQAPQGRYYHQAQLVAFPPSGLLKAVAMAGYDNWLGSMASAEVFEPTLNGGQGGWVALPSMTVPRYGHAAALLPSGKVLVSGGYNTTTGAYLASAEIFDPSGALPSRLPCSVNADCQGTLCVDGWCCNAACGGACDRCNVAGSEGVCTNAPTGDVGQPQCPGNLVCHGAAACPATCLDDTYCLPTAYCSAGSCVLKQVLGSPCTANDQCLSNLCVDSVCCDGACSGACDVCSAALGASPNGHCTNVTGPGSPVCGGGAYVCTGTSPSCPGSCNDDSVCAGTFYCNTATHQCVPKLAKGAGCGAPNQCQAGLYCVDGFCCDSLCNQQCGACNVGGHQGTCFPVTGAPVGGRAACAGSGTCGGQCDGTTINTCTFPGAATQCRAASCASGVGTLAGGCDGAGACPAATTVSCGPYVCGPTACRATCASDTDCAAGSYCDAGGHCVAKGGAGADCASNNQCGSGLQCVDGKCCTGACTGQCEACNVAGHAGTCWPVTGAPAGARTSCLTDGTACGGACDGSNRTACTYPAAATVCRAGSCTSGTATSQAVCAGTGSCPALATTTCSPYACGPTGCRTTCAADGDCVAGFFCDATAHCAAKYGAGHDCGGQNQCAAGLTCVDGVCCTTACGEQCRACNLPGSVGTCAAVTGAPVGGRAACQSDGTVCAGACDGASPSCAYAGAATACRNASCSGGVATAAAGCNGGGACPVASTSACGAFACGATACRAACSNDSHCAAGNYCSGGNCLAKHAGACTTDNECTTGHCADGVCCDRACGGQCEACNAAGSVGTCAAVTGAPKGPRPQCAGAGACAGSCNGTNTATCTYPAPTTPCRGASCAGGTATLPAACDGVGNCPAPALAACAPYVCGQAACKTSCAGDADCVPGDYCDALGHCAPKLALGGACGADTQCLSSHCADGVCCDDACLGQCQACTAAGHCAAVAGPPRGGRPACQS